MDRSMAVHRRYNPLAERWILVSPHRAQRPWQGGTEDHLERLSVAHDPECYLCPGNTRANGAVNPDYCGPWVFLNDFPALSSQGGAISIDDPLLRAEPVNGECRVMCFSPDHSKTLPQLSQPEIRSVIDSWARESADLGQRYAWVQIFENKGAAMGCSNPHPHGQIWASSQIPDEPAVEDRAQLQYYTQHGRAMLVDLARREADGPRVVIKSDAWLAIVPWWASWPFETLVIPRTEVQRIEDLSSLQRDVLGAVLGELTARYDNLFGCSFPYSMGWHGAPYASGSQDHWQLHLHFYPPLLRSATVRKFMVGYEMLAEAQRDLTPEQAAELLRAANPVLAQQERSR